MTARPTVRVSAVACLMLLVCLSPPQPMRADYYELGPDSVEQSGRPQGDSDQGIVGEPQGVSGHGPRLLDLRPRSIRW